MKFADKPVPVVNINTDIAVSVPAVFVFNFMKATLWLNLATFFLGRGVQCLYLTECPVSPSVSCCLLINSPSVCFCSHILGMTTHDSLSNGNGLACPPSNPESMLLLPMQATNKEKTT